MVRYPQLTNLCSHCRLFFEKPPGIWAYVRAAYDPPPGSIIGPPPGCRYWFDHHSRISELFHCARIPDNPCHLCRLIWHIGQRAGNDFAQEGFPIEELDKVLGSEAPPIRFAIRRDVDGPLEKNPLLLIVDFGGDIPLITPRFVPVSCECSYSTQIGDVSNTNI